MDNVRAGQVNAARPGTILRWSVALAILLAYVAVPDAWPDMTAFNADDSEAYLSLAYALGHGLGYTRSLIPGQYLPHTTWPPGLPLLLAPLMAVLHLPLDWLVVKEAMILLGLCGIVLTWLYVRRIAGQRGAADAAAVLIALNPFYWHFSRMVLSEVPSFVFAIGCLLLIDLVWRDRAVKPWEAGLTGLVCGLGMLLRGNVLGLALVPLAYVLRRQPPTQVSRVPASRQRMAWLLHFVLFCVAFVVWAARNRAIDTSQLGSDGINQMRMLLAADPFDAHSALRGPLAIAHGFWDNLIHRDIYNVPEQILPGFYLLDWRHWPFAAGPAVLFTLAIGVVALSVGAVGAPLLLVIVPWVALLSLLAFGGSARYWVPITSMVTLLLVIRLWPMAARLAPRLSAIGATVVAAAFVFNLAVYVQRNQLHPYMADFGDMIALFEQVRDRPEKPAAMLTEHQGIYTFITGAAAPLNAPAAGLAPHYTHLICRIASTPYASTIDPPSGTAVQLQVGAWRLYALPRPMTVQEIETGHG
jgi:hypothetical protein